MIGTVADAEGSVKALLEWRTSRAEASLVGRTRRTDSPLTPRELDVAVLVAQDCSNAEIARRHHLSERTVEDHVRSALLKIGGTSRTALALWHARTGHR